MRIFMIAAAAGLLASSAYAQGTPAGSAATAQAATPAKAAKTAKANSKARPAYNINEGPNQIGPFAGGQMQHRPTKG